MAAEPRKPETENSGAGGRRWWVYVVELATGIVLALAAFLLLVEGLHRMFPDSTDLGQLVRRTADVDRDGVQLYLDSDADPTVVALLADVRNDVRQKPATSITWSAARTGQELWDRHAIQSYGKSGATIRFDGQNRLQLGERSLIVVRRPRRQRGLRRAAVLFMDGFLKMRLRAPGARSPGAEDLQLDVVAGKGTVRADPTRGETAEIGITTRGTESSIAVYDGAVEIEWEDRKARVEQGYAVSFDDVHPPGAPQPLPETPRPLMPEDGAVFAYRSTPPRVAFAWTDGGGESSRLEISEDEEFSNIAYEGDLAELEFVHGNLEAGRYHWRVRSRRGAIEGLASPTRTFEVRRDARAPRLDVDFPSGILRADTILLQGTTDPGARVVIGDATVTADASGRFEHTHPLHDGYNFVVVQAIDPNGNTSFRSHTLNVQLQRPER